MTLNRILWVLVMGAVPSAGEKETEMKDCPMHLQHMAQHESHFAGVTERGDQAMGFSHQKTVHHFGLTQTGGFISAEAADRSDTASRDAIRQHFEHIAKAFAAGDFSRPMLIHAKSPPGVAMMKKLKTLIDYGWEQTERGSRVVISTHDREALNAIHRFLRFQIEDHRTGDSVAIRH
jgi:hypothetical protein